MKQARKRWRRWMRGRGSRLPAGDAAFPEFYARSALDRIKAGIPHPTLGRHLDFGQSFGESGRAVVERLCALGLEPQDAVVDYGCGTLRIGVHIIRHLEAGNYWGLDISPEFLEIGKDLVGASLLEEKRPHLHVIGANSLAEAAAARPRFVLSFAVLMHVPPALLGQYFDNLSLLLGRGATGMLTACVAPRDVRISRRSWAFSPEQIETHAGERGLSCETLTRRPSRKRYPHGVRVVEFALRRR